MFSFKFLHNSKTTFKKSQHSRSPFKNESAREQTILYLSFKTISNGIRLFLMVLSMFFNVETGNCYAFLYDITSHVAVK